MSTFVELQRVMGGYIVVNLNEVITITEHSTSTKDLGGIPYKGKYCILSLKGNRGKLFVKENLVDIKTKITDRGENEPW